MEKAPAQKPKREGCKFPIGDPRDKGFRFCDAPKDVDKSYCQKHMELCYIKQPESRKKSTGHLAKRV